MRNQEVNLSQSQQQFLKDFLAQAGKEAIGKKFGLLVDPRNQRSLEWERITIPLALSNKDLLDLSKRGYLKIYGTTTPVTIVFTELVQEHFAETDAPTESHNGRMQEHFAETGAQTESHNGRMFDRVARMDMVQVYAWLIASLVAALFFLFLLWLTVQQALQQHFSASVAAAIVDLISGSLTVVFFNNWNKANQNLSHLRSGPPDIKSQEINK